MNAADIARGLGGATRNGRGWLCRCPGPSHGQGRGDINPSLSLADGDDGRLLAQCFGGCDTRDILGELRHRGLLPGRDDERRPERRPPTPPRRDDDAVRKRAFAARIWRETVPAAGTPADWYLQFRSLRLPAGDVIRFHPRCPFGRGATTPALVARVDDRAGELVAVQRIALNPDGTRAAIDSPKRTLGTLAGGAVRLSPAADGLWIAEGIEDALALATMFEMPAWAVLGTAGFGTVNLPDTVCRVVLAPDGDKAGRAVVDTAASRLRDQRRAVKVAIPPAGHDWADLAETFAERVAICASNPDVTEAEARRIARAEIEARCHG